MENEKFDKYNKKEIYDFLDRHLSESKEIKVKFENVYSKAYRNKKGVLVSDVIGMDISIGVIYD